MLFDIFVQMPGYSVLAIVKNCNMFMCFSIQKTNYLFITSHYSNCIDSSEGFSIIAKCKHNNNIE